MELKGGFDPSSMEQELYRFWESEGLFAPQPGTGRPFCIAIPPPNVTGTLHIGHAFQMSLMDGLVRYHRMLGHETLWQTGTDHAGISTQMVVTEQLAAEGKSLRDTGRSAFIDRVWDWKETTGGNITQQLRRLGASIDWSRERFTMDDRYARAVLEVFVRLYDEGLIYRGSRMVNWDPSLRTALSDLETETVEEDGFLWHIRYPLADGQTTQAGDPFLVIATTRPETMLGDSAVAVHPEDERYQHLIGSRATLPLVGRSLAIVADEHVDREFGTGCLKVTPAHDFDDYEIGQRHDLPVITILTETAHVNDNAPTKYQGLERFEARGRIVADLSADSMLESVKPHRIQIPRGERSKQIVEPMVTKQWWVRIAPLAEPAIRAVEAGRVRIEPKRWEKVYFSWMRNIRDWCISRQLWWGHRIPAWYDEGGNTYVGRSEAEVRAKYCLGDDIRLEQDSDVLETWFSSSLWTFAALGWPDRSDDLAKFHPTTVLITGHDIIFFWVARMIMMTLKFMDEVPFHTAYIHGIVRDAHGRKMSKTAGNGLDPLDIIDGVDIDTLVAKRTANLPQPRMSAAIEKRTQAELPHGISAYGTDALRFTMFAIASPGSSYNFDLKRVEGNHHFCNKLWNASKFVLANCAGQELGGPIAPTVSDRWIRSRTRLLVRTVHESIAQYRFDLYADAIYQFAWGEFCDWYLEISKTVLADDESSSEECRSTRCTLLAVLEALLRTAHPIMPFVTEEIWRKVGPLTGRSAATLMHEVFPAEHEFDPDAQAEETIAWLIDVVSKVRTIRGTRDLSPKRSIQLLLSEGTAADRTNSDASRNVLTRLSNASRVGWLETGQQAPPASIQTCGTMRILIPFETEQERLQEVDRVSGKLTELRARHRLESTKLSNPKFVERAPADVVERARQREKDLRISCGVYEEQNAALSGLG